jgi:hypothetical protein
VADVPPVEEDSDEPYELTEMSEAIAIGQEAVLALKPRDRVIFQLHYEQGLSPQEVCRCIPQLSPDAYQWSIRSSSEKVLVAFRQIASGKRCEELDRGALREFLAGTADPTLTETVEAHLKHCRSCQRHCAEMRGYLREMASTLALASTAGAIGAVASVGGGPPPALGPAAKLSASAGQATAPLRERGREFFMRIGAHHGAQGGVGQALGVSGVKVGAICAGVAAAACAAAGIVPGINGLGSTGDHPAPVPARSAAAPVRTAPTPAAEHAVKAEAGARSRRAKKRHRRDVEGGTEAPAPVPAPESSELEAPPVSSPTPAPVQPAEPASAPPVSSGGGGSSTAGSGAAESGAPEFGIEPGSGN